MSAEIIWFRRDLRMVDNPALAAAAAAGDVVPDYPEPLVDLKESRAEAISRFGEQRG